MRRRSGPSHATVVKANPNKFQRRPPRQGAYDGGRKPVCGGDDGRGKSGTGLRRHGTDREFARIRYLYPSAKRPGAYVDRKRRRAGTAMPLATVYSRARVGVDAPLVTVEVHLANGLPGMSIVGLPEAAVREARDRVKSALQT